MAEKKLKTRIQQKADTSANWGKATAFVPLKGEYIYYSDLHKAKVGDGTTTVGNLPFLTVDKFSYTKNDVGLGNVDNTSDLNKPISNATQAALNKKANNSRHYKSGNSGNTAGTYTYYKLASFPIDNNGNSCSLTVDGRIGGWNNGNKGYLSMMISNRDGVAATGTILGNASLSLCDLVVYTSGSASSNSTATLYIKTYSYFAFDFTLGAMNGVTDAYDGVGSTATPAGTLQWSLSANASNFLRVKDDGTVLKNGQAVATTNQLPGTATNSAKGLVKGGTTNGKTYGVSVASDGSMTVSVPWTDTNTDTHWSSYLYIGAKGTAANKATNNGDAYLKLYEDGALRSQFNIKGSGGTVVATDSNGGIVISSPATTNKNATLAWGSAVTLATVGSTNITATLPAEPTVMMIDLR